jgi:hypothetical protein
MAILTTVGKQWIVDAMRGTVSTTQQYVAWGTGGATGELASQSALVTPSSEARTAGTITSPSAALHRTVGTITSTQGQTISEVGLFDASTAGVMMIRAVFTGIPLVNGDSIAFTIDLTQT